MNNLDLEAAERIVLKVLNATLEEAVLQPLLFRRLRAAALEGIRGERERMAQWMVNDTHSMVCRGTAGTLQASIHEMGRDSTGDFTAGLGLSADELHDSPMFDATS